LGGDDYVPQQGGSAEISGFESSFPAIDTQNEVHFSAHLIPELRRSDMVILQAVAPGGTITGTGSPFPATGYSSYTQPEEESEAVR
jgi:hypothetical protein